MKIAIITLHRVYNYGSVLQAFATQELFKQHKCDVRIIDYITPIRTKKYLIFNENRGTLAHKIGKVLSIVLKEMTFGRFIRKYLCLTKKYITDHDLDRDPPIADLYVTGSDQTWNSDYNKCVDRGFFLDFVRDTAKRISFISSFGKNQLDEEEKEITYHYLSRYDAISVREDKAVDILRSIGITKAVQLVDPTLLIDRAEWLKVASKRLIKQKYLILMLLYQEDNHATEYARRIADKKGLKLVKISWELKKPCYVDILKTHRSPSDFLSLFNYAEFVVTNSFHGLAFSINLEKQFVVVPRKEYNSRIESLLRLCGLSERLVTSENNALDVASRIIDYEPIRNVIQSERERANIFISEALGGVSNDENGM